MDKTRTWEGQRDWTRRNRTRGRSCLGGPLRSCSQDLSNKRTNETGSGRTMTLSSLNKANYSKVRAWGHRRWALITRQTALSCPIKWNSWHLTTQQRIASVWRNKYSFVNRMPLSRKSWCHHRHCESRLKMSSSLDMTLWTSLYYLVIKMPQSLYSSLHAHSVLCGIFSPRFSCSFGSYVFKFTCDSVELRRSGTRGCWIG